MKAWLKLSLGVSSIAALWGCSTDDASGPRALVVDSAGVRLITYDLHRASLPTYRAVGGHDLEIGVRDGAPEYIFSSIPDAALTTGDSIVVSDDVSKELRVYDRDGTYQRSIGGQGDGPGEFAGTPMIIDVAGDTVFAFDRGNGRVTAFALDGELIGTTSLNSGDGGRPFEVVRRDDGSYLTLTRWLNPDLAPSGPHDMRLEVDSAVIQLISRDGEVIDTLRIMADRNRARITMDRGGGVMGMMQAQPPYTHRAFLRSDGVRTFIGRSDSFELELSLPGEGPTLLRVLGLDHPATRDEIRAHREAAVREATAGMEIDPRLWRLNVEFLPDRLPAFAAVAVGDGGDVWVAVTEFDDSEGYDWLVFSPSGELRGKVHTPPGMRLLDIRSDHIIGVVTDEFDVPFVRRYPLMANPRETV